MCVLVRVGGRALIEPDADQVKVLALSFFGELYFLSRSSSGTDYDGGLSDSYKCTINTFENTHKYLAPVAR